MVEMIIQYTGDLHCTAKHQPSGAVIQTDAPVDNQGRGEAFSTTDLLGAALGTCMVTIMGIAARRYDIELKGTRVVVRKTMSTDSPRRIAKLEVDFYVPLPANHPQRALLEKAAIQCPIHQSLHPNLEQVMNFYWEGV